MNRFLSGIVVLLLVVASGTAMASGAVSDSIPNIAATSAAASRSDGSLSHSPGSGSLSGRILDNHGSPLPGATVYIPDLKLGVIADTAGYYKFNTLPSGRYLIEAHSVGFKTLTKTAVITGPVTLDFVLSDSYVEESAVVVTGLSKATQIKRNPVPIVSISHDYLATNISSNAIDAIAKIPGVRAVTTGPNVSKPFIRGLGYNPDPNAL